MSQSFQNVVVLGGSGNLGPAIVQELIAAKLNVTATTRIESTATFPEGVKVVKTDYTENSLVDIFRGNDAVISLVGAAQLASQPTIIDAAIKAGIKRFFPSEFGSDVKSSDPETLKAIPLFQTKLDVVHYLESKEKDGLSWTAIVSGLFFDWGLKAGFLELDAANKTAAIWDSGSNKITATNLRTIGKAIVSVLTKADVAEAAKNKYVNISSHTFSQNELLALVEEITGDKWTVSKKNSTEEVKKAKEAFAGGNTYALYDIVKANLFADGKSHADAHNLPGGLWDEKLGLEKEDLKEDLKKFFST